VRAVLFLVYFNKCCAIEFILSQSKGDDADNKDATFINT